MVRRGQVTRPTGGLAVPVGGARPARTDPGPAVRTSGPPAHVASKYVTRSGRAVNGLAHSDGAPVIGWASITTTNGVPG